MCQQQGNEVERQGKAKVYHKNENSVAMDLLSDKKWLCFYALKRKASKWHGAKVLELQVDLLLSLSAFVVPTTSPLTLRPR